MTTQTRPRARTRHARPDHYDVIELEVEVPQGKGLLTYDLRELCAAFDIEDPSRLMVETNGLRRAIVTIYRDPPLEDVRAPRPDELVMTDKGFVTVGLHHDGTIARNRLYVPGQGAQRCAMFGTTGAGKSRTVQLRLICEKRSGIVSWFADLKNGQSCPEARGQVDWHARSQVGAMLMLMGAHGVLVDRMDRYAGLGRSGFVINNPDPLLVVTVDECNRLLEKGSPYRNLATFYIKEIGRTGRSVGVGVTIAAQAAHIEELGGSDTLRAMLKEGEVTLLRWSSGMMQSLVTDDLLPTGMRLAPIPKYDASAELRSRFAPPAPDEDDPATAGMAYLLGTRRPGKMMRHFRVGGTGESLGLDPEILALYGTDAPRRLEETSHTAAGEAYSLRHLDTIPEHLVAMVEDLMAKATGQQAAGGKSGGGDGAAAPAGMPTVKPTIAVRVQRVLSGGALALADVLAAVNADGGDPVTNGSVSNALAALKKKGVVESPGKGVYELIEA